MTLPTIYELGFDPLLNRGLPTMSDILQSSISDNISTSVLGSGEMVGNYTIKDGYFQSSNFVSGSAGWQLGPTGAEINVSTAILSLDIPDATTASSFHTDSDGNSWWGCNVADFATDNDNAKAYILKTGVAKLQDVAVVGTISGRSTATIASAINASGNFIDANLDTSGKEILGDFTFGASGAIKMITDANNGLWISPTGILGKKAGDTTLAIGIDGTATFAGTLSAATGTLGKVTISEVSGGNTHSIVLGDTGSTFGFQALDYEDNGTIEMRAGTGEAFFSGIVTTYDSFRNTRIDDAGQIGLELSQLRDCTESSDVPILARFLIDPGSIGQGQSSYATGIQFVTESMALGDYKGKLIDIDLDADVDKLEMVIFNCPLSHSGYLDNDVKIFSTGVIQKKTFEFRQDFYDNGTWADSPYSWFWDTSGTGAAFSLNNGNKNSYFKIETDSNGDDEAIAKLGGPEFSSLEYPILEFPLAVLNGSSFNAYVAEAGWYNDADNYILLRKKSGSLHIYIATNEGSGETETDTGVDFTIQDLKDFEIRLSDTEARLFIDGVEKDANDFDPSGGYVPYFRVKTDASSAYNASVGIRYLHVYKEAGDIDIF